VNVIERVGYIEPGPILDALSHADWATGGWRARLPFSPHRDSDTLMVRGPAAFTARGVLESREIIDYPLFKEPAVNNAVWTVATIAHKAPARVMAIRLHPGGKVDQHRDRGSYADVTHRYHVALQTNAGAWLMVEGETRHLQAGEVWYIDKHLPHCGGNDGQVDRIHLIVDVWGSA
jgi:hypothetical protein